MSHNYTPYQPTHQKLQNQLEYLADQLAADVRPGHCDYISKRDAAAVLRVYVREYRQLTAEVA